MQKHLDQASHNQNFHNCIEGEFTDNFFDWKITTLFYVALHWIKALGVKRGYDLGETHYEIERNINPGRDDAPCKISQNAWRNYKYLFNYSRTSRYEGFTDISTFQKLMQADHNYCLKHIEFLRKYVEGQGIKL